MWAQTTFDTEKHSLTDWVRIQGGIKPSSVTHDAGEIRHVCSRGENGYNLLNHKRGLSLDQLTSDAIAAGWLGFESTHCDFLAQLGTDIKAKTEGKVWCRVYHPAKSWDAEYIEAIELETEEDLDFYTATSCSSCGNPEATTLYLSPGWSDTVCDDCLDMLEGVCRGN